MSAVIKTNKKLSKKHALRAEQLLQQAWARHQAGFFQDAEAAYLTILNKYPNYVDAIHLLGVLAKQLGQFEIAIQRFQQTIKLKPDFAVAQNNLGDTLQAIGRTEEAIKHLQLAIKFHPGFAEAYYNLGNCLQNTNTEEAIRYFEQAIKLKPELEVAHNNLGNCYLLLKSIEEALFHYSQAIKSNPNYAEAYLNLGNCLHSLEREKEAILQYQQVIKLNPENIDAHYSLGECYKRIGVHEEAIRCFDKAIELNPHYIDAHINLGICYKELSLMERCIKQLEHTISLEPNSILAYYHLSLVKPKQEYIPIFENFLASLVDEKEEADCHYALGKIYDSKKSYSKAFVHIKKCNVINRNFVPYDAEEHSSRIERLMNVFSTDYFENMQWQGSDSEQPVFILGMPRSGTTLIEQIVSNHPEVYGAGELRAIAHIADAIARQYVSDTEFPECMTLLKQELIEQYAEQYLDELYTYSQQATRITDKMPGNFLHIGLIKTLFPRARIIHCMRNPLDTCVSIFMSNFKGHGYSRDLKELGLHYLDYHRLMEYWNTLFPSEIFNVQYEELIENQETMSRRLIEYIGLDWDKQCLSFHENKRAVKTASSLQVRQPIYTKSVNRWKRYEEHLGPLIEILKDHI